MRPLIRFAPATLVILHAQGPPPRPTIALEMDPAPMVRVAPTRVVLEGRTRGEEIYLHNGSSKPVTYRLHFEEFDMSPEGDLVRLPEGRKDGREASRLVRFSPREVRLEPGTSQVVRLVVRKPANLPPGEYRSHLAFDMVPEPEPRTASEGAAEGMVVRIRAVYGLSIPVILRHGEGEGRTALANPMWDADRSEVRLTVLREGEHSIHGELRASFLPAEGPEIPLAARASATLYTGLKSLTLRVPIPRGELPEGKGRLKVVLMDPLKAKPLAETEIPL